MSPGSKTFGSDLYEGAIDFQSFYFWPFLAIFCHFLPFLVIFGHIATSGHWFLYFLLLIN
jgi:hypothetical protein